MAEVYGLSDSDRRKIAASLNLTRRMPRRVQGVTVPPIDSEPYPRQIEWRNGYSDDCPPGGVIKIYDYEIDSVDASWRLIGTQPDTEQGIFYAVNGSSSVAAGAIGQCLLHGHALAKLPDTVVQGATVYAKDGSWDASNAGSFVIGKALGDAYTRQVNDDGDNAGLKPILFDLGPSVMHGTAKANWKKQTPGTGNWPSRTGEIGYVEVDNVIGLDTATTFRVWIPTLVQAIGGAPNIGDGDPNVYIGQPVTFIRVPGKADLLDSSLPYYEVSGDGYVSATIGTVVGRFSPTYAPEVPNGWAICNSSDGDIREDMTDYIPLGNARSVDTTTGGLSVVVPNADVAAALASHGTAPVNVDNDLTGSFVPIDTIATNHTGSGTNITVNIDWANSKPKTRGMYWLVRVDNAAN